MVMAWGGFFFFLRGRRKDVGNLGNLGPINMGSSWLREVPKGGLMTSAGFIFCGQGRGFEIVFFIGLCEGANGGSGYLRSRGLNKEDAVT